MEISNATGKMIRNNTMQKWIIKLQNFYWTVERIPEKDNHIADWLSRKMSTNENGEQIVTLKIEIKDKGKEVPGKVKTGNSAIKSPESKALELFQVRVHLYLIVLVVLESKSLDCIEPGIGVVHDLVGIECSDVAG
ncbi:hypothetical protein C2G38_2174852 [Gigaspora rosea]|uniref:Uncharacterized protein n=1 Tax=Gigaspora rosea TaxID=44941 RepID=A0A397VHY0_9GLOM|nr:hypothetical protein C2G38_2174852 [Gigaspora rosea]